MGPLTGRLRALLGVRPQEQPETAPERARREAALEEHLAAPVAGPARTVRVRQLAELADAARAVAAAGGDGAWLAVAQEAERLQGEPFAPRDLQALRAGLPPTQTAAGNGKALDSGYVPTELEHRLVPLLGRAGDAALALFVTV